MNLIIKKCYECPFLNSEWMNLTKHLDPDIPFGSITSKKKLKSIPKGCPLKK